MELLLQRGNQSRHRYQPYPMHLTAVHRTPQIHHSPHMHQDKVPHVATLT